jgi:hypothetical protein
MFRHYTAVLSKIHGGNCDILPPDDDGLLMYAEVPIDEFEGYCDDKSPFVEMMVPNGSLWVYSVHPIVPTGDPHNPMKAGVRLSGPHQNLEETIQVAEVLFRSGQMVCIHAGLITVDRSVLN